MILVTPLHQTSILTSSLMNGKVQIEELYRFSSLTSFFF